MKILIVRMYPDVLNYKNYNCQEIGLAKALIRKKNSCDIVLYTDKEEYEEDLWFDNNKYSIHIYHLNAKSFFKNAFFSKKLYEIVKKYDIVQTSEYDQLANVKLMKIAKKMVIYHGPYESEYTKGYKIKCLISDLCFLFQKKYKNVFCITKSELATNFLKKKGFKNIATVGVGLDIDRFEKNIVNNEIINDLISEKKNDSLKYLLYIGKVEERRNILFIIDILERIVKKDNKVKLIIVGTGDKKYVKRCFDYAKEKNVFSNIIYFEKLKQDELPALYGCSDMFVFPTQYEIFGMVLLEAMYFGVPIITTMNGGSSTLIKTDENGIICDLNDSPDIWANKIQEILKNGYKKKQVYSWNMVSNKILEAYKKI